MTNTYPITVPAISVTQPLGTFYVVSLPARVLLDTAYSDRLRARKSADGEAYELEGSQRGLLAPRLRDIGAYIATEESTFPNSIILAPNFDPENGELVDEDGSNKKLRWQIDEIPTPGIGKGVSYALTIPTDAALAPIIDGQHRLYGFNFCDKPERLDTELVCSLFLDLPKPFQAFLFATINSNQKPVDKSQTFELFGYNIEKEPPGNWSPDKLAVYFARKLNTESDSPLCGKILVAAENDFALTRVQAKEQGKWMVSMATVVEGVSRLFSQNTKRDRTVLLSYKFGDRNREVLAREAPGDKSPLRELYLQLNDKVIYTAVKNFLVAAQDLFWSKCKPDSFICKTVGVQALFDVLLAIAKEGFATRTFSVDFFAQKLAPAAEINFGNERFKNASGSGRLLIKNCIFFKAGLEKEKIENLKEQQRKEIDEAIAA